ncbi:maleylpyruvate isomerase mycothiol-dependent enzyme family protein [Glycomyces tarimensis]
MSKPRITDYLIELKNEAGGLREIVDGAVLGRTLPSRPEVTVAGVLCELVRLYHWTVTALGAEVGEEDVPEPPPVRYPEAEVIGVFDESLGRAMSALESHSPESAAWTWAPVGRRAEFWHRRVTVVTALARWDVQMAVGATAPIPVALAAETISEVLEAFIPAGVRRGEFPDVVGLAQLFAQDADASWFVRLRGGRVALLDHPDSRIELQARAAGSASDIALALWGRLPFGICDVVGDEALLRALRVE